MAKIIWLEPLRVGGELPPWRAFKLPRRTHLLRALVQYALDNEVTCSYEKNIAWLSPISEGVYRPVCYEVPARISLPKWDRRLISSISRETMMVERNGGVYEIWSRRIVILDTKRLKIWHLEPLLGPLLSYLGTSVSRVRTVVESAANGNLKAVLTWENKYGSRYRERVKYFRPETKKARTALEGLLKRWPRYVQVYYNEELGAYKIEGRGEVYHNHVMTILDILITAFGWVEEPPRKEIELISFVECRES
jgi:hypothetical protein